MTDHTPTNLDEIEQVLQDLEQFGLIRRTGEFRDGKPTYEAVKLGGLVNLNVPTTRQ